MSGTATLYSFKTLNEETGYHGSDLYVVAENLADAARVAEQSVDPGYRISAAEEDLECVLVAPEINQKHRINVPRVFRDGFMKAPPMKDTRERFLGIDTTKEVDGGLVFSTADLDLDIGERYPFLDDGDPALHTVKRRGVLGGDDVYRAEKEELASRESEPRFHNPDLDHGQDDCSETFEDEATPNPKPRIMHGPRRPRTFQK